MKIRNFNITPNQNMHVTFKTNKASVFSKSFRLVHGKIKLTFFFRIWYIVEIDYFISTALLNKKKNEKVLYAIDRF